MKKILTLLSALTITASTSATIVACSKEEDPFDKNPPNYDKKDIQELKQMLKEKEDLGDAYNFVRSKTVYEHLLEKDLVQQIKLKEDDTWGMHGTITPEYKDEVYSEVAAFMQVAKESYDVVTAELDIPELEYRIHQLDKEFETEFETKEDLIKEIEDTIDYLENLEYEPNMKIKNYLHKDARKYAKKIIDRNKEK